MIRALRKKHLQIWFTLAVLLPIGIFVSWLAIPDIKPVKILESVKTQQLPLIIASADKKNYWVNIRTNQAQSVWQLEWINKYELEVPSAVIYRKILTGGNIESNEMIGRIEARDSYLFRLSDNAIDDVFILYDFIHETIIDSISFKTFK